MTDTSLIKDKIDIVDFINEYVQLKPAGINHKGLCPFHQEKTPSFMVNRERQSFHCFGCGKGGDIFTFLQEMEGMEFVEALKYLAGRAGVQLTNTFENQAQSSQKQRIKDINAEAARFYHNFLLKMDASKPARDYLEKRGLKDETIEEWQIGFIPDQWDLLTQYLLKKGHSIDDLVASGLTIKREGASYSDRTASAKASASQRGFYDRFRGRIMFPIYDIHGNVVGFTGRILVETDKSGGKYVNTPQTVVYDKSRVVFGLYRAKQEIKSKDLIVMVEGQTDVIASHQAGMKNVVASSGTALTEHQVKLLKRYSKNINMAFDSDEAGIKAAKRGIEIAISEGMDVKVIHIPEGAGKDPDECIKKNKDVWFKAATNAEDVMQWYFNMALSDKDLKNPKQKQQVVNELLPEIVLIPYAVETDHWLQELSGRIGVDVEVLRDDLARVKKQQKQISDNRKQISDNNQLVTQPEQSRLDLLVEQLFSLIFLYTNLISAIWLLLSDLDLSTTTYNTLYNAIKEQYNEKGSIDTHSLRNEIHEEGKENIVDVLLMKGELDFSGISEDEAEKECKTLIEDLTQELKKKRRKELEIEIEKAEKEGNQTKLIELMQDFQELRD